jgi:hemerythrin superfamily protein
MLGVMNAGRASQAVSLRGAERLSPEDSTTGTRDVLDLLERDHRRVEGLFARSALSSTEARFAVVTEIVAALTVHAQLEESEIYPAIDRTLGAAKKMMDLRREEHAEMKAILDRLAAGTSDSDEFVADLRRLQVLVQAHVAVEEGEIFPAFRAAARPRELRQLAARARDALTNKPSKPNPARR